MKLKSYLLFGLATLFMAACSNDYEDWKQQATNEQGTAITFGSGSVAEVALIDFATIPVDQDSVKICDITAPTSSYKETESKYEITLTANGKEVTLDMDNEGRVLYSDFKQFVEGTFGKNPNNTNVMDAIVTAYTGDGKTAVKNVLTTSGTFNVKTKVQAPFIDPNGYYIVGNIDGWKCKKIDEYHLVNNGGDVYENPVFTFTMENDATKFEGITTFEIKLIPASAFNEDGSIGNWGIALASAKDEVAYKGNFTWDNTGGNIKFAADANAKFYNFTFDLLAGTYEITPLSFDPFIFFIGATDGWSKAEQRLALTDQNNGIYTGYLYCADPNNWGNEFKFQKVAGDWGTEINSGHLTGGITGDFTAGGGSNIKAAAGEGVYYVTLNMKNMSLYAVRITNMNLVGDFNGWNQADDAQQMTWNATDFCFEKTGAGVTSNGWKFTANNSWDINLGGDVNDLTAGGSDIKTVVGTTIKLYPTRKTSDKIYCTVE